MEPGIRNRIHPVGEELVIYTAENSWKFERCAVFVSSCCHGEEKSIVKFVDTDAGNSRSTYTSRISCDRRTSHTSVAGTRMSMKLKKKMTKQSLESIEICVAWSFITLCCSLFPVFFFMHNLACILISWHRINLRYSVCHTEQAYLKCENCAV